MAAVLVGTPWEIEFYDYDTTTPVAEKAPERFDVQVITDGTHEDALHKGSQLGRTIATKLPPGEEGVRIPRGLDIPTFWKVLEECVQRADEANMALAAKGDGSATA